MDKKGYLARGWCCATPDKALFCGMYHKAEMYHDRLGYYWCAKHKVRGVLLDYAVSHSYPTVQCGRFAVGDAHDPDCWKVAVLLGSEELVSTLAAHLGLIGEH